MKCFRLKVKVHQIIPAQLIKIKNNKGVAIVVFVSTGLLSSPEVVWRFGGLWRQSREQSRN